MDPLTLERNPLNHLERSELSRLRTSRRRQSWDDRRATPNPMELDFVASGKGRVAARRPIAPSTPNQGAAHGATPTLHGASPGAAAGAGWEGPLGAAHAGDRATPSAGLPLVQRGPLQRISAQVMTARPWVPATRAAVESDVHDQPSDTVDSRQRVASRIASLLDTSTLGGTAQAGVGGEPAPGPPAIGNGPSVGSRSLPSGRGVGLGDPGDDPSIGYYRSVVARLERALRDTFPRWAIAEGRGGLVVFDLTLSGDGRVAKVAVVRPSGVAEYDRNVVRVVNAMPGFGRVPVALGGRAVLRISYDSRNPVVGRSGPGPGHLSD
jgi:TonB family protein